MTINQSYTPEQRKLLAQKLRLIHRAVNWRGEYCSVEAYICRVLSPKDSFTGYLESQGRNIAEHPQGREGYCREALNRLADELEACK